MLDSNFIKCFFTLLRSGLWSREVDDLTCFPLNESEWGNLYKIAREQTVEALIYDGIQKLPKDLLPPRSLLLNWVVRLNRIEDSNREMDKCIEQQILFFNKIGVNPLLLKGQVVANYYPNRNHRICGDIDWYFTSKKSNDLVKKILKSKNIPILQSTNYSISYQWRMCEVEQHTKLFDVFNPFARKKLEKIRKDRLNEAFFKSSKLNSYYELPADLNILQVNLHILKHLLSFGIGLRQLCDSAILYDAFNDKYDKDTLFKMYKAVHVVKWVNVLHGLLVKYIGLDKSKLPFDLKENTSSDWMLMDILSTGNFGFYDSRFTNVGSDESFERKDKGVKLWYSFKKYYPIAPYEAAFFPIVHFLERFKFLRLA